MNPLTGIIDSYDIAISWQRSCLNLWGNDRARSEVDRVIVRSIHDVLDDVFEHIGESLSTLGR